MPMPQAWDWRVSKTSFSGLDSELRRLADGGFEIYQIIAVQEVKPARVPFEVVVISRKAIEKIEPTGPRVQLSYSPDHHSG